MGQQVDAHTQLPWLGHGLEDRHVVSSPIQAQRRDQPTYATTGDQDGATHSQDPPATAQSRYSGVGRTSMVRNLRPGATRTDTR